MGSRLGTQSSARWLAYLIVLVLGLAFAVCAVDFGTRLDSCATCGATRVARHCYVLGIGGDYRVEVRPNPFSRFLERQLGPCTHDWEFADGTWGPIVAHATGVGAGMSRAHHTLSVYWDGADAVLEAQAAADPDFVAHLTAAVRDPSSSKAFWRALNAALVEGAMKAPEP